MMRQFHALNTPDLSAITRSFHTSQIPDINAIVSGFSTRQNFSLGLGAELASRAAIAPAVGFNVFNALDESRKLQANFLASLTGVLAKPLSGSLSQFHYPGLGVEKIYLQSAALAGATGSAAILSSAIQSLSAARLLGDFGVVGDYRTMLADSKTQRDMMFAEISRYRIDRTEMFANINSVYSPLVDRRPRMQREEGLAQNEVIYELNGNVSIHHHKHFHFQGSVSVVQIGDKNLGVVGREFQQSDDIVCDVLNLLHDARILLVELPQKFQAEAEERIDKAEEEAIRLPFNPDSVKKSISLLNQIFHTARATQSFCYRLLLTSERF